MAYIDELRKYTDQPVYGQGGFNLGGIIQAIQNLIKPAPAPKPAASAPKSTPKAAPKPTPSYSAPKSTPASAPMSSQAGAPRSYQGQSQGSVANAYKAPSTPSWTPPKQIMSPAKTVAPIVSKSAQVVQPKQNNAMADLRNAGSGMVNILGAMAGQNKGMVPQNYNYANDLRKTLGGLVGTAGTIASNAFLPKAYAADYNPYEFGLSEMIAGTGQQQKQPMRSSAVAGETSGQTLGANSRLPGSGPLKSGYVSTPGYSQYDTANKDMLKAQNDASQGATNANNESNDLYAILADPNVQAQIDQANEAVYQEYVNGNISYEDYMNRANEEQRRIIEGQYARAKTEAESQIPGIEGDVNSLVDSAQTGLNRYSAAADQEAARQASVYDENTKQSVKNQKMSEGNLRNVFSNLGTAESSAFMDKLVELTKEAGGEQAGIQSQKATALGDISKGKLYETQDTEKYINDTRTKGSADVANIRKYIQNLSGQQTDAISNLMSQLYSALGTGQQNLATQKAGLADRKAQQATNLQSTMQNYGVNSQLIKDQFAATQGLQGTNTNDLIGQTVRPSGVPSDMWGLAGQLYNAGLRGTGLINELKKKNGIGWSNWYDTLRNQLAQ